VRTHRRSLINVIVPEEKAPTSAGPSSGRKPPRLGANHVKRDSNHLQRMKSVVHNNSLETRPLMETHGNPSKRTVTQSVAPQSHLRGICCFQQHHADHPDGLCYQGHLRSPAAGDSCRDVTPAIASSVLSVIVGGAIISVRRSVSAISLQNDLSRSGA
jgi:hypothetical protein